ncbi:MAG: hypothetical protein U9R05_11305, partial [Chloroflexota bacterium]|nr:hypothetical protein [Chloroflexota bacterium]
SAAEWRYLSWRGQEACPESAKGPTTAGGKRPMGNADYRELALILKRTPTPTRLVNCLFLQILV